MTSSKQRPNFYNSILQALLVCYILTFVICMVWMFFTSDACGVYVYGSIAIYSLLSTIGVTLLQRWYRTGGWLILAINIGLNAIINLIFPLWSSVTLGTNHVLLSLLVSLSIVLVITLPLFIFKCKPSNKIIWSEMNDGLDFKHFRHVYQLSCLLILTVGAIMAFKKPVLMSTVIESNMDDLTVNLPRDIEYSLLDSANITLNEIVVIEGMIDSLPQKSQLIYNRRIFALKHVLLSGLMTDRHNTMNLINICKIHTGDFSPEQQKILDWYISLPKSDQEIWLDCPSVDNLYSFENEIKQRLSNKQK